jgi:hypothetical protein
MMDHRPDPLTALQTAVRTLGLDLPDELLRQVLEMELASDPHGSVDERRARLRRLLEGAAGANE